MRINLNVVNWRNCWFIVKHTYIEVDTTPEICFANSSSLCKKIYKKSKFVEHVTQCFLYFDFDILHIHVPWRWRNVDVPQGTNLPNTRQAARARGLIAHGIAFGVNWRTRKRNQNSGAQSQRCDWNWAAAPSRRQQSQEFNALTCPQTRGTCHN